jgi:hypothetical protein
MAAVLRVAPLYPASRVPLSRSVDCGFARELLDAHSATACLIWNTGRALGLPDNYIRVPDPQRTNRWTRRIVRETHTVVIFTVITPPP